VFVDGHEYVLVEMHGIIIWGGLVTVLEALRAENSPRPGTEIVLPGDRAEGSKEDLRTNSASGTYLLSILRSAPAYV
jgi:hypothetical protein